MITHKIANSEPWESLLPNCACENRKTRVILFEGNIYCGECGMIFGKAGCVGLLLTKAIIKD